MTEPFLTVVTRHCAGRENLLERNRASLRAQTDQDYEQVIIVDEIGRGLPWAEKQLEAYKDRVNGRYVYILDDDDYLVDDEFIKEAKKVSAEHDPDVIMVRMRRLPCWGWVLPEDGHWGGAPEQGHVGSPCYLIKRGPWKNHIHRFSNAPVPFGDFHLIRHLWDIGCSFHWLNRIVAEIDRIGHL